MEARYAIYSNIVESITNLINALDDLNIKLSVDEDEAKMEESKSIIFKYSDTLQKNTEKETRRNCYSMDELSGQNGKPDQRQMSTEVFRSSTSCLGGQDNICPPSDVVQALKYLWSTTTIQKAYERRNEFQLIDSASYFMNDLDRVCTQDYEPTDDDILHTRIRTTGIVKIEFEFRHLTVSSILTI